MCSNLNLVTNQRILNSVNLFYFAKSNNCDKFIHQNLQVTKSPIPKKECQKLAWEGIHITSIFVQQTDLKIACIHAWFYRLVIFRNGSAANILFGLFWIFLKIWSNLHVVPHSGI